MTRSRSRRTHKEAGGLRRLTFVCALCAALAASAVCAAGQVQAVDGAGRRADSGWITEHRVADGDLWVEWFDGRATFEAKVRGQVEFAPDGTDIRAISQGGSVELTQKLGTTVRTFKATAHEGGDVSRQFDVSGVPGAASESVWLASVLTDLLRNTGLDAQTRVRSLYERGGATAVLREISYSRSDRVKQLYYLELLKRPGARAPERVSVMRQAAREIASDEVQGQLLNAAAGYYLHGTTALAAYFKTLGTISSDEERAAVLNTLLARPDLNAAALHHTVRAVGGLSSDEEKSKLLLAVLERPHLTPSLNALVGSVARRAMTDGEAQREVLDRVKKLSRARR